MDLIKATNIIMQKFQNTEKDVLIHNDFFEND